MGSNVIAGGMVPKLGACLRALESVSSAHIVDGRRAGALIEALEDAGHRDETELIASWHDAAIGCVTGSVSLGRDRAVVAFAAQSQRTGVR